MTGLHPLAPPRTHEEYLRRELGHRRAVHQGDRAGAEYVIPQLHGKDRQQLQRTLARAEGALLVIDHADRALQSGSRLGPAWAHKATCEMDRWDWPEDDDLAEVAQESAKRMITSIYLAAAR